MWFKVTQNDSEWHKLTEDYQCDSKWLKVTQSDSNRLKLTQSDQNKSKWLIWIKVTKNY